MTRTSTALALVAAVGVALAACAAAAAPEGYVLTPFGYYAEECVHGVPDGAAVHNEEGHLRVEHPEFQGRIERCSSPLKPIVSSPGLRGTQAAQTDGEGWQAYVHQKIGTNSSLITTFNGQWNVPATPREQAQTLFSFTGLQNIDWVPPQPQPEGAFDIIQPVLQFGSSAAGGGGFWSIASWYVTLGQDVVYSELKKIPANGTIVGVMERTAGTDDSWYINTVHQESGISSATTVKRTILKHQPWAYVTLEVYDVEDCEQYPAAGSVSSFTKLDLQVEGKPYTPQWTVGTQGQQPPVCGSNIRVNSPTDIDIVY